MEQILIPPQVPLGEGVVTTQPTVAFDSADSWSLHLLIALNIALAPS